MSAVNRDTRLAAKVGVGDTARAETELPLSPDELLDFLRDIERLIRLNPLLAIECWMPAEWGFRFAGHNESNDRPFEISVRVDQDDDTGLNLRYDTGLKQITTLRVESAEGGSRLIVNEHYPVIEDQLDPRLAEVDKSLVPWVAAIHRHLWARRRWAWLPGWGLWNERFMLGMPPRQRRIVRLLIWTSLLEFIFFIALVLVWRAVT